MITNDRIAEALERAADLYESEKVDWCQGAYVANPNEPEPVRLSVCASQALRIACGEKLVWRKSDLGGKDYWGPMRANWDSKLFIAATASLGIGNDPHLSPANGEGHLITWNDQSNGMYVAEERRTKQDVIDLFKNRAKELRNQS